ncbi:MAG: hypothetical protein ACK52I_32435 [Pseudomonadota bacterium]
MPDHPARTTAILPHARPGLPGYPSATARTHRSPATAARATAVWQPQTRTGAAFRVLATYCRNR